MYYYNDKCVFILVSRTAVLELIWTIFQVLTASMKDEPRNRVIFIDEVLLLIFRFPHFMLSLPRFILSVLYFLYLVFTTFSDKKFSQQLSTLLQNLLIYCLNFCVFRLFYTVLGLENLKINDTMVSLVVHLTISCNCTNSYKLHYNHIHRFASKVSRRR